MKRLLAISWEMPPLSGPRAVQVTRTLTALGDRGWRSRVVCFDSRSDRYQQDYRVSVEERSAGAVTRLPVPSPEEWLFFRALWHVCPPLKHLPDEKRVWMPAALAEARRALLEAPADVLVSFAQPWTAHLVGLQLHRETGLPWVAHFSDPWVDSPFSQGPAWVRGRQAAMELAVVTEATALVFVNQYTLDRVMAKYPADWRSRAHVVPQGFEAIAVAAPQADHTTPVPLRIVYTGRFYDGLRTPDTLLEALAELQRARSLDGLVELELVGGGMDRYERRSRELGLDAIVRFSGRLSPAEARDRAATGHALITIDAPSDGPSLFLPSKLIDYLPLRKPIVGLTPTSGPSADLLRQLGYPVLGPDDVTGLSALLLVLLDEHVAGRLGPSSVHDEVVRTYDIRETTRAFERVLVDAQETA